MDRCESWGWRNSGITPLTSSLVATWWHQYNRLFTSWHTQGKLSSVSVQCATSKYAQSWINQSKVMRDAFLINPKLS